MAFTITLKKSLTPFACNSKTGNGMAFSTLGVPMAIDRRAAAYAEQFHGIFVSRYAAAARAGRADLVPEPIRNMVVCAVNGTVCSRPVDVVEWTKEALYSYRVQYGRDCPLPPEVQTMGQAVRAGAAAGAKAGVGHFARSMFRLLR